MNDLATPNGMNRLASLMYSSAPNLVTVTILFVRFLTLRLLPSCVSCWSRKARYMIIVEQLSDPPVVRDGHKTV